VVEWVVYVAPLFASPLVALLYTKTFGVGKLKPTKKFVGAKAREAWLADGAVVVKSGDREYVGVAYLKLDDSLLYERLRSPDEHYARSLALGRIISGSKLEVELRVARVNADSAELAERLKQELTTLRALIESQPGDERLAERERILKKVYEKVLNGEKLGWMKLYIVLRHKGESPEAVVGELKREALELARALSITLGVKARLLSKKELAAVVEGLFATSPPLKPSVGSEEELSKLLPAPPFERESFGSRGVFLGYRLGTRIPYFFDVAKYGSRHVLILGPTGKGKTTLMATVANRLYARNQVSVLVVDPKGDMDRMLSKGFARLRFSSATLLDAKRANLAYKVLDELYKGALGKIEERSPAEGPRTLAELEEKLGVRLVYADPPSGTCETPSAALLHRYAALLFDNLTDDGRYVATAVFMSTVLESLYAGEPSPRLRKLLAIDEAWRSSDAALYLTRRLIKESRGFGVGLMLSTQTVKDVPEDVLHNFGTVAAFGSSDASYVESVKKLVGASSEVERALPLLGVGQVAIKLPDSHVVSFVEVDPEVVV